MRRLPGIRKNPAFFPMASASCPAAQLPLTRKTLSPRVNWPVESIWAVPLAESSK